MFFRRFSISVIALFLIAATSAANAKHQYCVIPEISNSEKRICMTGEKEMFSVLTKHFGSSALRSPLGMGLPKLWEPDKMVLIFQQVNKKGLPLALSISSMPLDPRWHKAVAGCSKGDQVSCAKQAGMMVKEGRSAPRDVYSAHKLLISSCNADISEGCFLLGQINFKGLVKEKNIADGIANSKKACDLDHSEACFRLGQGFTGRFYGIPKDFIQAGILFDKACRLGSMGACSELGYSYAHGEGVERSRSKAAGLWKKACEGKSKTACFYYGDLVQHSSSIENKDELALTYYKLSCDLGGKLACDRVK